MFNKNYLCHEFINEDDGFKYNGQSMICKKCKIKILYYSKLNHIDDEYSVRFGQGFDYFQELITCDEIIIKNILE